ncbi:MAG: STAS domain-containing protein [Bacteroidetes bacterium]|nr:STAS domain-containing protein [Bacteroidota bacterium]
MENFTIDKKDKYTLVTIHVEKLDSRVSPILKSELVVVNAGGEKNIIIDLNECRYCDSSGLSALLIGNRLCKNENGTFVLDHGFETDGGNISFRVYGTYEVTEKEIILHVTKRLDSASRINPNPRKIAYNETIKFKIKDEELLEGIVFDKKQLLERE